ncbi:nucleoside-diphosphate sugar epimerase/dehydratase [Mesorhizobium sp. WSM2239]|uniref:Nucleoside-diphosphate sugar epimerase/dehydratase n=2 Tax=unclassified Mesorhizobium TaxID=325217 RepID=A0AAU8D7B5_9HYPH
MKLSNLRLPARFARYAGTLHDFGVAAGSFVLAYLTVLGAKAFDVPGNEEKTLGFVAIFGVFYFVFSLHRGSWRYVSIPDLIIIIKVALATTVTYTVASFLMTRGANVPRSVPVLAGVFMVTALAGSRLACRLLVEKILWRTSHLAPAPANRRNVLLYGLNDGAESFIRASRRGQSEFNVAGILDDSMMNQARTLQGVRVLGSFEDVGKIADRLERTGIPISELIVTEAAPTRQHLGEIVEKTAKLGIKTSIIPDVTETALITSRSLLEPKEIELGDLLDRPEVVTDISSIARLINNKTILATGAGGSIGSELCRQIAQLGPRLLVITDSSEFHLYMLDMELREKYRDLKISTRLMDVRDSTRVSRLFAETRPDVVFHAAALKHVPLAESNPLEAIKTNFLGTKNVADAALVNEVASFVMISTDKAVNPTNVMGATKRAAEAYCQALDINSKKTHFKTVRFGNVLGSNGSVVPRFQEQILAGGPVTVTHPDIVRFFMTIPEAVRLVLNASAEHGGEELQRGKIMVLDMGEPVRIVDLAERMMQLAGLKPYVDIDIVFSGLRPGEKLFEELFDPSEVQDLRTEDGYVVASPRVIDKLLLDKSIAELQNAVAREDRGRALELLLHIVPEYRSAKAMQEQAAKLIAQDLDDAAPFS